MKIYKHEYDSYKKEIKVYEVEVIEKPKTFIIEKRQAGVWESRISKEDINKLECRYGIKMYALSPVKEEFIKAIIQKKEANIQQHEKRLKEMVEEKEVLQKMLNAEIQAVQNDL